MKRQDKIMHKHFGAMTGFGCWAEEDIEPPADDGRGEWEILGVEVTTRDGVPVVVSKWYRVVEA